MSSLSFKTILSSIMPFGPLYRCARVCARSPLMLIKLVVIVMLLAIFASLFSALVFLFKDQGRSRRVVQALTWRIGLSVTLFLLLMAGFYFGIIPQSGIGLFRHY